MIVHLRGAGFVNKGAELMLTAAVSRLGQRHPQAQFAIDVRYGTPEQRRALGLKDLHWMEHHRVPGVRLAYNTLLRLSATRSPRPNREGRMSAGPPTKSRALARLRHGMRAMEGVRSDGGVLGADVDVVLDLSGFAYGDLWGAHHAHAAASYYAQVRRRGGRVVLMPQQLGPFEKPEIRSAFHHLSAQCDVIYAREQASFECARAVVADASTLHQAPDFTVLQKGIAPSTDELRGRTCIIPNYKMIRETGASVRRSYPDFLRRCVLALRERGVEPVVLMHEQSGRDHELAHELTQAVGHITVVDEPDPLRVKGIIAASHLVIGSRFHGLVSALSQAVPSIGTGWSHKYRMLFEEYGCPENLVAPDLTDEELAGALRRVLEDTSRGPLIGLLRGHGERNAGLTDQMWQQIDAVLTA